MIYPEKKEFLELAKKGNVIPVCKDILADFDTTLSSFRKIDRSEYSFLLESVEGGERLARYSFMGSNPSMIFKSKGRSIELIESGRSKKYVTDKDPIGEVQAIMSKFRFVPIEGLPIFCGGLVGYIGYDMVRFFEEIPDKNEDDLEAPDAVLLLTDTMVIFDHVERKIKIISNAIIKGSAGSAYSSACAKIRALEKLLKGSMPKKTAAAVSGRKLKVTSNFTKNAFANMIEKGREYIKAGDIIQVVLSQRLKTGLSADPFDIYRALRSINPSPYMFYLKLGDIKLIGSSPEIMVRTEKRIVEVRPIAGTRPRGKTETEDRKLIKDLLADPKELAEHIMLVDLGRNDIGRVANYNTVKTNELMRIEKYSHVIHIVSDVTGILKKGKDMFDVIRATFPAGTVSGAPKVRAMEIIDELENTRRGPYAGCVGYFSFSGNEDFCITIRTMVIKGKNVYVQAGAGIVKDSKPMKEYEETFNKARALLRAIEAASKGLDK